MPFITYADLESLIKKAIEKKKIDVFMNKLVYLGLAIMKINKTVIYEFW